MKAYALATIATLGATLMATCANAASVEEIKARGKIIVGVDIGHPPYGMLDANAKEIGSDVETAKLLAEDMGVALEMVAVSGASRVPFLTSDRVDMVISSFSITDERKQVVDFSRPYGVVPVVVATPASMGVKSVDDLSGHAVAAVRGTTTDLALTKLVKDSGAKVEIVRYEDEATANTAVITGQQQIIATALSSANSIAEQNPNLGLEVTIELAAFPMGIGLRKGDDDLRAWTDEWVSTNLHNGKLNDIYKKYFKQDLPKEMLD
ncbi:transporter substrate-binding domain-containing protein [Aureimonas fodinaquatilis]|uniref:Transporter substrate-binding domain-containing protein n=1 Tax=Aureimonas fodinaquatilis TaxID=2565783 RepID=A0A5B0DSL1_9HYPH|nr:transporter substrate-binding domain-containing protein [Aureimonas fodinaquatilis]KAA0969797.1 transporter substrate-binding domain-containing protein [Aureimonas fodinaquatilis]